MNGFVTSKLSVGVKKLVNGPTNFIIDFVLWFICRHWIIQAACSTHPFSFPSPFILHCLSWGCWNLSKLRVEAGYTLD